VTNKPTPFVAPLLEALDIAKYFSVIVGGDDVQKKAASGTAVAGGRKIILNACGAALCRGFRNDILAARAAGCPSVGLTYGYNYGEAITLSEPDVCSTTSKICCPHSGFRTVNIRN
jgi:phosphoglycolate phosphatase